MATVISIFLARARYPTTNSGTEKQKLHVGNGLSQNGFYNQVCFLMPEIGLVSGFLTSLHPASGMPTPKDQRTEPIEKTAAMADGGLLRVLA